jgi:hypothetical protein
MDISAAYGSARSCVPIESVTTNRGDFSVRMEAWAAAARSSSPNERKNMTVVVRIICRTANDDEVDV